MSVDSPVFDDAALSIGASDEVVPATDVSEQASMDASGLFAEGENDQVDVVSVISTGERERAIETRDQRLSRHSKVLQRALLKLLAQLHAFDLELDIERSETESE
jgi:hypothetical protein